MPDINPKYKGEFTVALTKFGSRFGVRGFLSDNLRELKSDSEIFGPSYEVLSVYKDINAEAANKLKVVASQLQAGEKIDTNKILQ